MDYKSINYQLAIEVVQCGRLVEGYSDTHARGLSKFDRVIEAIVQISSRSDSADWARRMREAAMKDEDGVALDEAILTIKSFS